MDDDMIISLMRPGEFLSALDVAERLVEIGKANPGLLKQEAKLVSYRLKALHESGRLERRRKKNVWSYGSMRALAGQRRAQWTDVLGVFYGAPR